MTKIKRPRKTTKGTIQPRYSAIAKIMARDLWRQGIGMTEIRRKIKDTTGEWPGIRVIERWYKMSDEHYQLLIPISNKERSAQTQSDARYDLIKPIIKSIEDALGKSQTISLLHRYIEEAI